MADNYVVLRIKADDTAKPDLTDLKAKLEELGSKVSTAKVDVDDREGTAKLYDLNAKLADLNRKVASPRITVAQAARAEAQIAALSIELDKLGEKTARPKVELEGAAETTAEVVALDAELDHLDDKAARAGPGGLLKRIIGSAQDVPVLGSLFGPQALAIIPAVGALLTEVVGLASGFAAAGAGAGAFALLAAPAVKSVETAYTRLSAAQAAYKAAQDKAAAAPTKANETAVKTAALNLQLAQDAIKKLPAGEQAAIDGIHRLATEFGDISKAFEPEAFKVFNAGLQLAGRLLPDVVPFARTFADVLSSLLGRAGKFASSKGFGDWLKQFHSLEGPALNSIGSGIGNVATAIGKLLTTMSGKDVAHAINIAFGAAAGIINGVTWTVRLLMGTWDALSVQFSLSAQKISGAFDSVRHGIAGSGHDIAHTFDGLRHTAADLAHNIAARFDEIRHTIASWASDVAQTGGKVITWFRNLPGKITGALSGLPSMLEKLGEGAMRGLLKGLASLVGTIKSAAASWGHDIANALGSPFGIHFSEPSEATVMVRAGQRIPLGLADGMLSGRGALNRAAAMVSAAAYPHPGGGYGLAGAGGGGRIVLEVTGGGQSAYEQFLLQGIRNLVRVKGGGDTQKAFGRN